METYIYYAIQLPCDPKFDFNIGFYSKDRILEAMRSNYGREFHFEDKGVDPYGQPVTYVKDKDGIVYARVVEICVKD